MSNASKCDVLIVGAGPAGCAAGIELARAGVDVCVVDAAQFPRDKVCGDAISNEGMREVEALGAADVVRLGPHALVRRAAAVFPGGERITRSYDEPGYIVPRFHIDDCLRRALEQSGARLLQNCRVTKLLTDDNRITGAIAGGQKWSAKLVIAADGYGSVGLTALGLSSPRGAELAVSTTAYYRDVTFPEGTDTADHFFEDDLPYGYGWIFPAVEGVANIGVYIRSDAYATSSHKLQALLDAFIKRHADRFAKATPVAKPRTWSLPLAPRRMPVTTDSLLLVGDAAGFVDPLSGEGIWQALHSGRAAGRTAARAIREGNLSPALREQYQRDCEHTILRPSRGKAWVQRGLHTILRHKLYRHRSVRALLHLGYEYRVLEMTKS